MQKSMKECFDRSIERILILIENAISVITVIILSFILLFEFLNIFANPLAYMSSTGAVTSYLHEMLTIVVGLEFVKLLMHLTPANVLEVLVLAISRSIIVSHGNAMDNLVGIVCIVMLFATRRFLIPKQDLHHGLAEDIPDEPASSAVQPPSCPCETDTASEDDASK